MYPLPRDPPTLIANAAAGGAQGSFGLVLSNALDAEREIIVAARGQTMSVSFYPSSGVVSFGSEASATKVCASWCAWGEE